MPHPRAFVVALAVTMLASVPLAGCGRGEPDEAALPTRTPSRISVAPEDTPTDPPTSEADATAAARATLAAAPAPVETITATAPMETLLPDDPEAVIVQLARLEPKAWEPELLAQMEPHFSLQADGYGVFSAPYGDSATGWYQTTITPSLGLNLLKILMDDIDVLDLAERYGVAEAEYATGIDGKPAGTDVLGVIYVHAKGREGRLVIPEKLMESPPEGPDKSRLTHLHAVVVALEVWKQGLFREFEPALKEAIGQPLGFWSDVRMPYSPTSGVAYGTRARSRIDATAPVADWPLPSPALADAFDAAYGAPPAELILKGDDLTRVLEAARQRPDSPWGPLWQMPGSPDKALVGVRVAVPGSNQMVIDYTYALPKRGTMLPTATPAPINP